MQAGNPSMNRGDSPCHVALVVKDAEKTAEYLTTVFDIGPWNFIEWTPSKDEVTVGELSKVKAGFCDLGSTVLEILQPLEEKGVWYQFLKTKGEGLHHISFGVAPNDWDRVLAEREKRGAREIVHCIYEGMHANYYDTEREAGFVIELQQD